MAIVTGARRGVGRASAIALLKEGYRVVLAGRREERLRQSVAEPGFPESRTLAVPAAAKHAITGLTKSLALEGRKYGIACGQINIGNTATEMAAGLKDGVLQANGTVAPEPLMDAECVARAVVYMAGLPLDANVLSLTIMATAMPFVGRG